MTIAAGLTEAANLTPENLLPLWQADTLQAAMIAFGTAANPIFEEQSPDDRPLGAWIAVIAAFAPTILDFEQDLRTGVGTITTFEKSVDYIYRICKFGASQKNAGLITTAQANALLAAYNAQFG